MHPRRPPRNPRPRVAARPACYRKRERWERRRWSHARSAVQKTRCCCPKAPSKTTCVARRSALLVACVARRCQIKRRCRPTPLTTRPIAEPPRCVPGTEGARCGTSAMGAGLRCARSAASVASPKMRRSLLRVALPRAARRAWLLQVLLAWAALQRPKSQVLAAVLVRLARRRALPVRRRAARPLPVPPELLWLARPAVPVAGAIRCR